MSATDYKWLASSITSSLEELRALSQKMARAKSPAEISTIRVEMEQVINGLNEESSRWARNDARDAMRDTYRGSRALFRKFSTPKSGAEMTSPERLLQELTDKERKAAIPKRWRDRSLRLAQKHEKAFQSAAKDLRVWANGYEKSVRQDKAVGAINARLKDLEREFNTRGTSKDRKDEIVKEIRDWQSKKKVAQKGAMASPDPKVQYRRKKRTYTNSQGKKVTTPASVVDFPADKHYQMLVDTAVAQQRNLGSYAFAAENGLNLLVMDGPECGWVDHEDAEKANGKVVTWEEAAQHPLAHPNCQRQFFSTKAKPRPGKKASKTARQRANQVATGLAVAGVVGATTAELGRNPLVQKVVRDIVDDAEMNLSSPVKRLLNTWIGNMKSFEQRAMALSGSKETVEQFRDRIAASLDQRFANAEFLNGAVSDVFETTVEQARALGLKGTSHSKGTILNAVENYGDFILHEKAKAATLVDNLVLERIAAQARERLGMSAVRYSITKKPGQAVFKNWSRSVYHLKQVIDADPDRMTAEGVRALAAIFDPTPWIGARMRNFKFTAGLSSKGRQDLAEYLYERFRGLPAYHPKEIEWAKRAGIDLTAYRVKRVDLVKALIPRVSYLGKPFSATIALENGLLNPIVRFYPEGTYTQFLRFQAGLRGSYFEGLLDDLKKIYNTPDIDNKRKKMLKNLLGRVDDSFVFSIDAFRNGPIQASIRWTGVNYGDLKSVRSFKDFEKWMTDGFSSFAIKLRPDQEWLRLNYRIYRHNLRVKLEEPYYVKGQLKQFETINRIDQEYKIGIVPLRGSAINLVGPFIDEYGNVDISDLVARLYVWRGNIAELSRLTGFSYESLANQLVHSVESAIKNGLIRADNAYDQLSKWLVAARQIELRDVRSLAELEDRLARIKFATGDSIVNKATREGFDSGIHPALGNTKIVQKETVGINRDFDRDLSDFYRVWERIFGADNLPRVRLYDPSIDPSIDGSIMGFNPRTREVVIPLETIQAWSVQTLSRSRSVRLGWLAPFTNQAIGSLIHEGVHDIIARMSPRDYRMMWQEVFGSYKTWAKRPPDTSQDVINGVPFRSRLRAWMGDPKMLKQIGGARVSHYGTLSADEFIAEAFTEYLMAPAGLSRNIAQAVGSWLLDRTRRGPFLRSV